MSQIIDKKLPKELTNLVSYALKVLGEATRIEYGPRVYSEVERIRQEYKDLRRASIKKKLEAHNKISNRLSKYDAKEQLAIAHSFAVSLELINACENTYRSYRLQIKDSKEQNVKPKKPIIFVLTAHPTEARSPKFIHLVDQIMILFRKRLKNKKLSNFEEKEVRHLILLMMKTMISKSKSPTVQDEADYIYSTLLKDANIQVLCSYYDRHQPVYIRSWVGGDKDGHPGIDKSVMLASLQSSRKMLVHTAKSYIKNSLAIYNNLDIQSEPLAQLGSRLKDLHSEVSELKKIGHQDGKKLSILYKHLTEVKKQYEKNVGLAAPELERLDTLLKVFPGLVVPLELREDSAVMRKALSNPDLAINGMLSQLRELAEGGKAVWYARGLVISMCESADDVLNASKLMKKYMGGLAIPIVPLYETKQALENCEEITAGFLKNKELSKAFHGKWDKKLEIMLGYSDSAKESGALFSRSIIQQTLKKMDRLIKSEGLIPIFFHGSGGSVERGGGSIKDQISWWPASARKRFKATIQGEMIYRTFSTPEILQRQIQKIHAGVSLSTSDHPQKRSMTALRDFSEKVRQEYLKCVEDEKFMHMVQVATPYPYLDQLKIGSRPSKRKAGLNLGSLRAIPWVLCWTQTRSHFPVWWGMGSVWQASSNAEKQALKRAYKESRLFSSFMNVLAFTLAKVDLSVWGFFLENSSLPAAESQSYLEFFRQEYELTLKFLKEITGKDTILWVNPWLEQSIRLRSTMIYPLNVLEVQALKSKDTVLLRETVTGVASGMMTTG
tara:strand:+ start:128 stop:2473 length:2346 start_codon:yes stop_codon:yes gene_type:complete